jgi:hypothetical protein
MTNSTPLPATDAARTATLRAVRAGRRYIGAGRYIPARMQVRDARADLADLSGLAPALIARQTDADVDELRELAVLELMSA